MKNHQIIQMLYNFKAEFLCTSLPTAAGSVTVSVPRKTVIEILHHLGKREQSPCRFYIRAGVGYISPVAEVPPPLLRAKKNRLRTPLPPLPKKISFRNSTLASPDA